METVLTQLEISLDLITELASRVKGRFVVNAAPALPLPAEVVDRGDLIIVDETEYALLPQLRNSLGAEAVMDFAAQPEFRALEHCIAAADASAPRAEASASAAATSTTRTNST
ncbi:MULTISPECIES: hypothetical protein [Brevibacterium]|uniref:Uncharacterized protein n=1 Tax=Brevibacterium antiquum CNRZ 918 TaxID=1255637 RepID=A0A2H1JA20_9MICO|nr:MULTISPECIES: hypothetical protein [Brevibacterium]SMX84347.1 hypothetical protein BANT918_01427 [Brevibacterium antiquum CNRZ 918]